MSDVRCDSPLADSSPASMAYAHYGNVKDAVTKGPVRDLTEIAALHTFGGDKALDEQLKNLTQVAEPAVRCSVKANDGASLPAIWKLMLESGSIHVKVGLSRDLQMQKLPFASGRRQLEAAAFSSPPANLLVLQHLGSRRNEHNPIQDAGSNNRC